MRNDGFDIFSDYDEENEENDPDVRTTTKQIEQRIERDDEFFDDDDDDPDGIKALPGKKRTFSPLQYISLINSFRRKSSH